MILGYMKKKKINMKVLRSVKGTEETVEYKSENNSSYNWSARNNTESVAKTGEGDWNNY